MTLDEYDRLITQPVLDDPAASFWLKRAITEAVRRDPADAANDAEFLAKLLSKRFDVVMR